MSSVQLNDNHRPKILERFFTILTDPRATFHAVISEPDFVIPALLILFTVILGIPVSLHVAKNLPELPPGTPAFVTNPGVTATIAAFSTIIGILASWFVRALVFTGVGSLLGASTDFKKSLSVSGYLIYSTFITSLISAVTVLVLGSPVIPGFGMAIPTNEVSATATLLKSLNLTSLIYVFLSTFGLAELWQVSRSKAFIATLIMWAIVVAILAGMAGLGQSLQNLVPQR